MNRESNTFLVDNFTKLFGEDYSIIGNKTINKFNKISSIIDADEDSITWISPARRDKADLIANTRAKLFICDNSLDFNKLDVENRCFIVVKNPRLVFTKILQKMHPDNDSSFWIERIHPTSIIHPDAKIHESVQIGPFNIIGNCTIGENSYIGSNNVIHNGALIGKRVRINEFNLLGGVGLGFERDEDGVLIKMQHIGKLIIDDDVEIFTHVNIDKGTLGKTWIKRGAKLDHHVHIGHNSVVGEDSIVVAHSVLCGGSIVGDRTWVGVGSYIKDASKIGNDVILGLGAIVTKNVPNNETWAGNPAQEIKSLIEQMKKLKNL